ncbi:right-handed parallel beta-helix repeat-containing protein [Mediterraneibacter glycyrrhizinilyticus]|uniref:right-handed parallel beta-helix repeat-containing protein n=1 Tax=Mediterraneibacter glycyrrhizinilyticus TaxID=342942 RepID=UPI001961E229|nr:right-handed parallel beta-helix repeat-containing protein [Mediterraneibacter glycyrrhizinilyticus]MBM6752189.1 right-handed parallel beta-helix repeat-containing protein [Mediterraneibacter glycyrrhizinilyticus]
MKIYVDAKASRQGNGSREMPFKHINDAAQVAAAGDEVLVAPGIYREYVNPKNAGTEEARIVYRSTEPLGAVITGAEEVKDWKLYQDTTWVIRINNSVFGNYNPYTTYVYGDWYFAGRSKHTGAVYLNDRMLYEAESLGNCIEGKVYECSWEPEVSVYKWYSEQDGDETVIYANFQGKNPNEENVEINVRRECFMPSETGVGYITVSGFNINKAATTWAPPAAYQDGMIGPHWSKGWIIEDCEISNSKCAGISLGKYLDPDNDHYFTRRHVKSPTQMERDAVCRGQYHGWLKEKVGSHIVRRCNIHNCEQGGIIGRMGGVFSVIEDNHIHHINNMMELGGAEIAGIKMHAAIDVIYRRNHIHHCTMGIWCDWEAQGTRITQNLFHDNQRPESARQLKGGMMSQDIFVEVGHGPTLIDNNILLSDATLRMATEGVAMVHNLICGALTSVGEGTGPRYTPYHIPHRTEVMGFMTILHGDDRFYNNIFVQKWPSRPFTTLRDSSEGTDEENREVGTHVLDEYPVYDEWIKMFDMDTDTPDMAELETAHSAKLPVWVKGNVYFNGAKAYKKETGNLVDTEHEVTVDLNMEEGCPVLSTNLYDFLGDFADGMVNSDILGYAFEPEERFENLDGTDIVFDTDYFGNHRGIRVLPGPFAKAEDAGKKLF